jgi:hypothetical protein
MPSVIAVLKLGWDVPFVWYGICEVFCYGESENAVVIMVHFD